LLDDGGADDKIVRICRPQSSFIDLCVIFMPKNRNHLFTTVLSPFEIGSSLLVVLYSLYYR